MPKDIQRRHDEFFKAIMSDLTAVRDFLSFFLPEKMSNVLDLSTISPLEKSFVTDQLKEFFVDAVFQCKAKEGDVLITILLEHKSYRDRQTPIQILSYLATAYQEQWKGREMSTIVPVILYQGSQKWEYQTIADLLPGGGSTVFAPYVPGHDIIFVDLQRVDDQTLRSLSNRFLASALMVQKYSTDSAHLIKLINQILGELYPEGGRNLLRPIIVYLFRNVELEEEKMLELIEDLPAGIKKEIMTTYDQLIAKGEAKGFAKGEARGVARGEAKGAEKKLTSVVLNGYENGLSVEMISRIASVTQSRVLGILREHGKNL